MNAKQCNQCAVLTAVASQLGRVELVLEDLLGCKSETSCAALADRARMMLKSIAVQIGAVK